MASLSIEGEDHIAILNLAFDWANSYDTKDFELLRELLAPKLLADYSDLTGQVHYDMPAEDFVGMASSPKMFGNPLLRTQHLLGATRLEVVSSTEVTAYHQVRSESIKVSEEDSKSVVDVSSRRVVVTMSYVKINGQWKISGMKPKALS